MIEDLSLRLRLIAVVTPFLAVGCGWDSDVGVNPAVDHQKGGWKVLAGTGGGQRITASWMADEKTGWLATDDGSLLVTHCGGDEWYTVDLGAEMATDTIFGLQVAKRKDASFYGWAVTREGRILHTADGKSWQVQKSVDAGLRSVQILGERSALVRAGRALWRTDDGGKAWRQFRPEVTEFMHIAYNFVHFKDRLHGTALFVREEERANVWHVETTSDGGKTWTVQQESWNHDDYGAFSIVHGEGQVHLYWNTEPMYKSGPLPIDDQAVRGLVSRKKIHQDLAHLRRTIYILSEGTIFVEEPLSYHRSYGCLLGTGDGGKSWQRKFVAADFKDIVFVDAKHGWVVGRCGRVGRTSDGGDHWIHCFLATDADFKAVYFVDKKNGWVAGGIAPSASGSMPPPGRVWRTIDGGVTWKPSEPIEHGRKGKHGIPEAVEGLVFLDRKEGWVVTHGKTLEPSENWRNDDSSPREYGRVLRTIDGGVTWKPVYYGLPLSAIGQRGDVQIAAGSGIIRSESGGAWQRLPAPAPLSSPLNSVVFVDGSRLLVPGGEGYYVSNDAGKSWEWSRFSGLPDKTTAMSMAFGTSEVGWGGGSFDVKNPESVFLTTDGGQSWEAHRVAGIRNSVLGGWGYWQGMSAVGVSHAWAISRYSIARGTRTASATENVK